MDLGQLRYFIKIVEHRSFTRAARDCSVSQPALSQQIAKLEKELGQPLFERQGRTIRLTAAGQILQAQAEKILQLVDDVKGQITDDGQTGRISIAAIPTIGPYFLPEALKSVGGQFQHANFVVQEHVTDDLLKRCANGDVDVGVLALPAQAKNLTVEPLFEEELMLALPASHRLAARKKLLPRTSRTNPSFCWERRIVWWIQSKVFVIARNFNPCRHPTFNSWKLQKTLSRPAMESHSFPKWPAVTTCIVSLYSGRLRVTGLRGPWRFAGIPTAIKVSF